jgi:hypothetical protein
MIPAVASGCALKEQKVMKKSYLDSSSLTPPPEPRVEAVTCNIESSERGMLDIFPYEGPAVPLTETPFRYIPEFYYRIT